MLKALFVSPLAAVLDQPAAAASPPPAPALLLNRFSIAGFQYHDGPALVRRLQPGVQLKLVREPANPYDLFAVEIFLDKTKLGYVPRSDNKHLSRLLEQDALLECRVFEADPEAAVWNRVKVEVEMVQQAARVIP
jgi:hypothetical protein